MNAHGAQRSDTSQQHHSERQRTSNNFEDISGVEISPSTEAGKQAPREQTTKPETEKYEQADGELGYPENDLACQFLQRIVEDIHGR